MNKAKVINLKNKKEYNTKLDKVIEKLEEMDMEVFGAMIELSTSDKWKEWSENQKEGTVFTFDETMFENCPDENVIKLLELRRKIDSTISELMPGNNG